MSLKKQASSGFTWTFIQQFGHQFIGFLVSMILARILLPEEFGLVGMIGIFIAIGTGLMDSGLNQSLIRGKEMDQGDYSTVFFFNLIASIILYVIIYFCAPLIANFYDQPVLTNLVRVYCLIFIISSFAAVQNARLTKKLDFKTQTIIAIPASIVGGIVGITMAYTGFGVWSLVWNSLVVSLVGTVQLWLYSKWTPDLIFDIKKFKDHFNFGYKLALSGLLDKIFNNIYLIVIGKYFAASQVGFYTRAETLKHLPVRNIANALNKVTYPLFATIQDDDLRLKRVYRQLMQMVTFVVSPVLIFMAVLGEPIFVFLFTEKWLPAVPFFQILCATGILYPIHAYNLNVLKVKGRSDLYLKLEIIKKVFIAISIAIAIQYGIYALLYSQVLLSVFAFFLNSYYTGKFIGYTAFQQSRDILPIILLSTLAGGVIYLTDVYTFLGGQLNIIRILTGGIIGLAVYLLFAYIFKLSSLTHIKLLILKK